MEIELMIGNESGTKVYFPAVEEGIEWTTQRRGAPGKLIFKVLQDEDRKSTRLNSSHIH